MFARRQPLDGASQRRGIVLVLILGMLALLALIGVTFASISSQAQNSSRKFAEGLLVPDAKQMFDYALGQLINDTQNPLSSLMGHGLLRDMYGNDAFNNGGPIALNITGVVGPNQVRTNVPAYLDNGVARLASVLDYGKAPLGWVLVANAPGFVSQSFEVLGTGVNNNLLVLTLSSADLNTALAQVAPGATYVLDGRYQRGFNGSGQTSYAGARAIVRATELNNNNVTAATLGELYRMPNFLHNDPFNNPNGLAKFGLEVSRGQVPLDEDYDACDLENMFLAIESADSSVIIPSFHRPGVIRFDPIAGVDDWTDFPLSMTVPNDPVSQVAAAMARSRFLRPRLVDHPTSGLKDLRPDPITGKIEYDVDNDADGITDSVWLDLGFPAQRDANGKLYKPLFAFKVIGTNGKLPLNTAGNLQARSLRDVADAVNLVHVPANDKLWSHASHIGFSVNEINPKYALQNQPRIAVTGNEPVRQFDNAGVSVMLTQLRNLLMGTRPQPSPRQPIQPGTPNWDPTNNAPLNMDANTVLVGDNLAPGAVLMPNNVPDGNDLSVNSTIFRNTPPVPGLWGEERGVPSIMPGDNATIQLTNADMSLIGATPHRTYHSRVGPGRSPMLVNYDTNVTPPRPIYQYDVDGTNDNYAALDFSPTFNPPQTGPEKGNLGVSYQIAPGVFYEFPSLPSERYRQFVTPIDVSGNGAIQRWYTPAILSANPYDGHSGQNHSGSRRGFGADNWGRVSYFNYFRPPGVPVYTDYRTLGGTPIIPFTDPVNGDLSLELERTRHNLYHGFFGAAFPRPAFNATGGSSQRERAFFAEAYMGAAPYNRSDQATGPQYWPLDSSARPRFLQDSTGAIFYGTMDGQVNSADTLSTGGAHPTIVGDVPGLPQSFTSNGQPWVATSPTDAYPGGSLGRDLAHELNLYLASQNDAPFGPTDLEWLYRQQDIDGVNLDSRLRSLAPISFVHSSDAPMRRKLFSVESWELNNLFWANDNPSGVFAYNTMYNPGGVFSTPANPNTRMGSAANASIQQLQATYTSIPFAAASGTVASMMPATQPNAHRGRKINLNAPLPMTNYPDDEVRQKWVMNTYQALKQVLPPKAVDTPEELLALSQYVLNIVDFRDPDAAMTHFVNPDVRQTAPTLFDPNGRNTPPSYSVLVMAKAWDPTNNTYGNDPRFPGAEPIDQWGMEFPPLALNEVLAYRFNSRDATNGNNRRTPRLWVELVNTLTRSSNVGGGTNPSDVSLEGWELAILPDDACGRPNPFTGQINASQPDRRGNPLDTAAPNTTWPKRHTFGTGQPSVPALRVDTDGNADNRASAGATPVYYVVGSSLPGTNPNPDLFEAGMPGNAADPYRGPDPGEPNPPNGAPVGASLTPPNNLRPARDSQGNLPISARVPFTSLFGAVDTNGNLVVPPNAYYWVYLLRPSNPLDPTSPKVVVDSVRVPYTENATQGQDNGSEVEIQGGGTIQLTDPNGNGAPKNKRVIQPAGNAQAMYSLARFQPYRGAQLVPTLANAGAANMPTAGQADYRFGFSEQHFYTFPADNNNPPRDYGLGLFSVQVMTQPATYAQDQIYQVPTTNRIYHTLGEHNRSVNNSVDNDEDGWDLFPFHDRDFQGVYELTMVPACPPGLFTKQFVESPPNPAGTAALLRTPDNRTNRQFPYVQHEPPRIMPNGSPFEGSRMGRTLVRVFPYLSDNFFYSAEGVSSVDNSPVNFRPDAPTFRGTPGVGGATGAGWHKMFELFDVPSSAMGAIGPVSSGANFDWYREDLRPGLINLNLIIDEEVFFGLIDDESIPKLSRVHMSVENGPMGNKSVPLVPGLIPYPAPGQQPPQNFPAVTIPRVVTQVDVRGYPTYTQDANGNMTWTGSHAMQNRGFDDGGVAGGFTDPVTNTFVMPMKAAFADFLKLRHGGSGFLFTHGLGAVGAGPVGPVPNPNLSEVTVTPAAERPFRSASFPDINFTIMRPATLPPSAFTSTWLGPNLPQGTAPPFLTPAPSYRDANGQRQPIVPQDPGVKHVYDQVSALTPLPFKPSNPTSADFANRFQWMPPATPPRRLFQLPDTLPDQAANGSSSYDSAASEVGDAHTRYDNTDQLIISDPKTYIPIGHPTLANAAADLVQAIPDYAVTQNTNPPPLFTVDTTVSNPLPLGGYRKPPQNVSDHRQHPIYRNEWMTKVSNLTTVRTHQYAVWLTVGFFEVVRPGDPINLVPDELGPEIGAASGQNVRFRGFFVVDRTRATGFDPTNPDDFRKVVAYSRRIE